MLGMKASIKQFLKSKGIKTIDVGGETKPLALAKTSQLIAFAKKYPDFK